MNSLNSTILFPFLSQFPRSLSLKICYECIVIVILILKLLITMHSKKIHMNRSMDQLHKYEIKKVDFNEFFVDHKRSENLKYSLVL